MYPLNFSPAGWGSTSLAHIFDPACARNSVPPPYAGSVATGTYGVEHDCCKEEEDSCTEGGGDARVPGLEETLLLTMPFLILYVPLEGTHAFIHY